MEPFLWNIIPGPNVWSCACTVNACPSGCSPYAKRTDARQAPFRTYLPVPDEFDRDETRPEFAAKIAKGWIIDPNTEIGLDEFDSLGASSAKGRPRFSQAMITTHGLKSGDPFFRNWTNASNQKIATVYAWGNPGTSRRENESTGDCLECERHFLRKILNAEECDLLILVKLERYKERFLDEKSRYWHTTAIVRVKPSLKFEYFAGVIDQIQEMDF
jgi:hypothetical protein